MITTHFQRWWQLPSEPTSWSCSRMWIGCIPQIPTLMPSPSQMFAVPGTEPRWSRRWRTLGNRRDDYQLAAARIATASGNAVHLADGRDQSAGRVMEAGEPCSTQVTNPLATAEGWPMSFSRKEACISTLEPVAP